MKFVFPWRKQPPKDLNLIEDAVKVPKKSFKASSFLKGALFKVKAVGYINNQTYRREKFERCEYNLAEIRDASEADSYIKIALTKYSYMIYKAGWRLKSENQAAIDYIMHRWRLMSFMTDKPMDILFQEIADDLVRYSNAFLIKSRVDKLPGIKAKGIFEDGKPIGGYFRVDPASIRIKRDKYGNILKYEQGKGENKKQWDKKDVLHIYMDKDANNAYGTPRIIAALDDVKLLRKLEGNVVALIHRFSMPLYHWKIGLPQAGYEASDLEIRKAKSEVESSSLDGLIITNEKTEIKAIGSEGTALNAEPYLRYFEDRCFSALGVSASQMGRGGAKQDADSMEQQIHDTVKYIQRIISAFIENFMINELLAEGGFDIFSGDNEVKYVFEEISLETKIKKENHEMLKFQSNMTTLEEGRRRMGEKDSPDNEERLYQRMISDKSALDQIDRNGEWQEKLAHINAAVKASSSSSSGSSKTSTSKAKSRNTSGKSTPNKAATNNNRPTNQHGTTSVKVKESMNRIYYNIPELNESNKRNYTKILVNEMIRSLNMEYLMAMNDAINDINNVSESYKILPNFNIDLSKTERDLNEEIGNILNEIVQEARNNNIDDISSLLIAHNNQLNNIIEHYTATIYNQSYIETGKQVNMQTIFVKESQSDEFIECRLDNIDLLENLDNYTMTFDMEGGE